ncbi:MAG: pilus assembly protein TadG-related protein [Elusimicrobiota bacterium]
MFNIKIKLKLNNKGQVLPLLFSVIFVMIILFYMSLNYGKAVYRAMEVQNAADNAALSAAAYRARVLNYLGCMNRKISACLYGGTVIPLPTKTDYLASFAEWGLLHYNDFMFVASLFGICPQVGIPILPMRFVDSQKKIGHVVDFSHMFCPGTDCGSEDCKVMIQIDRFLVNSMIILQDIVITAYPITENVIIYQVVEANCEGARGALVQGYSLGLERNKKGVKYMKTNSTCISWPPGPFWPGGHIHFATAEDWKEDKKSWLYADKKNNAFDKSHKMIVGVTKKYDDNPFWFSDERLPIWGRYIRTASASTYNPNGSMFVSVENNEISPVFKAYKSAADPGWKAHQVQDLMMAGLITNS